jgi:hypothetical protein
MKDNMDKDIKKPEIIQKEIDELKKQLEISKKHYQYEFICNSDWNDEMIGFFHIGNAKKIMTLLKEGKKLQYRHSVYGDYNVFMNSNGNRILVTNSDDSDLVHTICNEFENSNTIIVYKSPINEDTIMSFIVWHTGEWYLNKET